MKRNERAFTLIELLAVIIILGIILTIAIPNVSKIIVDSRKSTYIVSANRFVEATRGFINEKQLNLKDKGATFYIPRECIPVNKAKSSPYGEWKKLWVAVIWDGTKYQYYFTALDSEMQGVKLTNVEKLSNDNVEHIANENVIAANYSVGASRTKIVVFDSTCSLEKAYENAFQNTNTSRIITDETDTYVDLDDSTINIVSTNITPTEWTNGQVNFTIMAQDKKSGIIAYAFTKSKNIKPEDWHEIDKTTDKVTMTYSTTENGTIYLTIKNSANKTYLKELPVSNIDREAPVCTILNRNNLSCADNEGIVALYWGTSANPSNSQYQTINPTKKLDKVYNTNPGTKYYFRVKDRAGNIYSGSTDDIAADTTPPVCIIEDIINRSSAGVTVEVICKEERNGSGCAPSNPTGDSGLKNSKTYTIRDMAGNTSTCRVNVQKITMLKYYVCQNRNRCCGTSGTTYTYSFDAFLYERNSCTRYGFTFNQTGVYGTCRTTYVKTGSCNELNCTCNSFNYEGNYLMGSYDESGVFHESSGLISSLCGRRNSLETTVCTESYEIVK